MTCEYKSERGKGTKKGDALSLSETRRGFSASRTGRLSPRLAASTAAMTSPGNHQMILTNQQNYQKLNRQRSACCSTLFQGSVYGSSVWLLVRPGPRISQHGRVVSQRQMPPAEATRTASGFSNAHISLEICLASFFALKIMRCFLPQEWTQVGYGTRCIVQTTPRTTLAKSPLEIKVSQMFFKI